MQARAAAGTGLGRLQNQNFSFVRLPTNQQEKDGDVTRKTGGPGLVKHLHHRGRRGTITLVHFHLQSLVWMYQRRVWCRVVL